MPGPPASPTPPTAAITGTARSACPSFGQPGIAARTDYIVNGPDDCLLFLTAAKANRQEGPAALRRTTDGGKTWQFVSWIGPEPDGLRDHALDRPAGRAASC